MIGTEVKYMITTNDRPLYIYEFSATESNGVENATKYDSVDEAKQSADLLNQMAQLQGTGQEFKVRRITITIEEV